MIKQGDTVTIKCEVDACRTGLKKKEYRIKINGEKIWVDASQIETEE